MFIPNSEQAAAIKQVFGPLLVLSPMGTGKTQVMAQRSAAAVKYGVSPDKILCLTFTNRAAKEMKDRIVKIVPNAYQLTVRTFHSFCAFINRCEHKILNIPYDFNIIDEEDAKEILKYCLQRLGVDSDQQMEQILQFIADAKLLPYEKQERFDLERYWEYSFSDWRYQNLDPKKLLNLFCQVNEENHSLDFNDLLVNVIKLYTEHKKRLEYWREKYQWVQVDEIQDTRVCEYTIISLLTEIHRNIALFGDINQTIYAWRGANPNYILDHFREKYKPVTEVTLRKNYRSTEIILQASNDILRSYTNSRSLASQIEPESQEHGEKIVKLSGSRIEVEAEVVAREIRKLIAEGRVKYGQIALLARTNAVCETFSKIFTELGIPHYTVEKYKFFRRKEIKDIIAYTSYLMNKFDILSLQRIIKLIDGFNSKAFSAFLHELESADVRLTDFFIPIAYEYDDPFGELLEKYNHNSIVIFDTETTGLLPDDHIIEIAAVKIGPQGEYNRFHAYLSSRKPVGRSEDIHGISDTFLRENGQEPALVFSKFIKFVADSVIVGHNVSFDESMLRISLKRLGIHCKLPNFYDTLDLARRFIPGLRSYKLTDLCQHLDIPLAQAHCAMADTIATMHLFHYLMEKVAIEKEQRKSCFRKYRSKYENLAANMEVWRSKIDKMRPASFVRYLLVHTGLSNHYKQEPKRCANLKELVGMIDNYDIKKRTSYESLLDILTMVSSAMMLTGS